MPSGMTSQDNDTICAIATPPGKGGIGIVRISGALCRPIAEKILGFSPTPRHAHLADFRGAGAEVMDTGIALFFDAPHSFTGEDVLELQGHGGVFLLQGLLSEVQRHGARLARPGEFSERSFLNNKIDLAQAEAIADIIDATTEQAARSAMRTLQGAFSQLVSDLVAQVTRLRVYIEAAIDFSDEEVDFLSEGKTLEKLETLLRTMDDVFSRARQGTLLNDGMTVVIVGQPNAGKSSLLNQLSGTEAAIVTDVPGTTRDLLAQQINIDGMPVHVIDTAGLRHSEDRIEREGVRRARDAMVTADRLLVVVDSTCVPDDPPSLYSHLLELMPELVNEHPMQGHPQRQLEKLTLILNKCDLVGRQAQVGEIELGAVGQPTRINFLRLSALSGEGVDLLRTHLKHCMGYQAAGEGTFIARQRHLDSLGRAREFLLTAKTNLEQGNPAELVAEDLRLAQNCLGEITGKVSSDDLLGIIFSSFCIGK
ncbi:MAG: tRNA uridine-5-carboxymethylaminomethyl(34) synthesis GTPase MnmE [Pseudohongiellaceae bacterium]